MLASRAMRVGARISTPAVTTPVVPNMPRRSAPSRFLVCECAATGVLTGDSVAGDDFAEDETHGPTERTQQETKTAKLRAYMFFTFSMAVAIPFFCLMLAIFPFVFAFDRFRRRAEHLANKVWAVISTLPFNKVVVRFMLTDGR
jgi:hypothetical protein